jgi:hypothetical protein
MEMCCRVAKGLLQLCSILFVLLKLSRESNLSFSLSYFFLYSTSPGHTAKISPAILENKS